MLRKRLSFLLLFTMVAMLAQSAVHHIVDDHEESATCDYCLLVEQVQPVDFSPQASLQFEQAIHAVFTYEEQAGFLAFAKANHLRNTSSIRPPPYCIYLRTVS
ncbi:MAG: hypothetical protein WBG46_03925 [Nonlabens sp.]